MEYKPLTSHTNIKYQHDFKYAIKILTLEILILKMILINIKVDYNEAK